MEHQLPRGGGRINRPIADGTEAYLPSQQLLDDGHQMRHRPPEAIQPPDDQGIPGGQRLQARLESWARRANA